VLRIQEGKTWIQQAKTSAALAPLHVLVSVLSLAVEASIFPKIKRILISLQELAFDHDVSADSVNCCILPIYKAPIYSLLEISARSALEIRNAKVFRLLLELAEFLAVSTLGQTDETDISLETAIHDALQSHTRKRTIYHNVDEEMSTASSVRVSINANEILGSFTCDMANVLGLSIKNGSSKSVIDFLRFRPLLAAATIEIDDSFAISRMLRATKDTTCLTPNKVICESSSSSSVATCFQRVWFPLPTDRILLMLRKNIKPMSPHKRKICIGIMVVVAVPLALCLAVPALVMYILALIYVNVMHGMRLFADAGGSGSWKRSAIPLKQRCKRFLYRPFDHFFSNFKGNQSVTAHTLRLPGMGSLKNLKIFVCAPVDLFETPTVRAVVKGMWSRFFWGFYTRLALYVLQLMLYSAFACYCVSHELSLDTIHDENHSLAGAAFAGGCAAIVIAVYFLGRECLHCISCLMDEGLKEYIAVGSIMRICSHSLEIASLIMFIRQDSPASTRLVTTYAVFTLWINLMYFSKAIKQISYLVEILTVILIDLIPFMTVMLALIMAVTLALIVLVGGMESATDDEAQFGSFSFSLDYVVRVAEGRQDMEGSALSNVLLGLNRGDAALNAIFHTAYFYFYFLMCVISVVALNAFIALMGSSYEKVAEKKISQRWERPP
jgi:hypothetical protein